MKNILIKEKLKYGWNFSLGKMGNLAEQRHMASLRDGFALLVPLIIAASIGVICMTFVFGWWDTTSTSILGWITWGIPNQVFTDANGIVKFVENSVAAQISAIGTFIFYTIWKGIFSFLSIFVTLTISYSLARIKNIKDPFIASLVGLGSFMILSYGDVSLFGTSGILVAIITSLLAIELYSIFEKNKKLELKMPAGVPPAISRSFAKLFPTIFTTLVMIAIQAPFIIFYAIGTGNAIGDAFGFGHSIALAIQAPFIQLASDSNASLGIGIAYTFFAALLWFFGIHGSNVLAGVFTPLAIALLAKNQEYIAEGGVNNNLGLTPSAFADGTWDAFIFIGGTGATLAFVFIGLFLSKRKDNREIFKFSAPSSLFNINEPIVFGIPLILNFSFFIPYVLINPILYIVTWLCIEQLKWVPPVIVKIPWTTPLGIGGFLATSSWQGILLAFFNFALASVIYIPFVLLGNRKAKKNGEELIKIEYKASFKRMVSKINKNKKNVSSSDEKNDEKIV